MSSLAIPEQVSPVALPTEMQLGSLPFSLPADAMSFGVKIQPTNLTSVVSPTYTVPASTVMDVGFNSQAVVFDIPCNQSPDTFLDTRFSCLNFKATWTTVSAGSASALTSAYLRGGGYSWFDSLTVLGPTGNTLEQQNEWAVIQDTMLGFQMSNSARDGSPNYGYLSSTGIDNQGHAWASANGRSLAAGDIESYSYSLPLTSSCMGVLSNNFLNVGRLGRLQLVMATAYQLPMTITTGTQTTAGTFTLTLSDFSLSLEMVKIGPSALRMLDETLSNGLCYTSGITYRCSTASLPAASGSQQILVGTRGSSIKSLFARFQDGGTVNTTNQINGKFGSTNPNINNYDFSIGGVKFPQTQINPLLQGAQCFVEVQKAMGTFNSSQYQAGVNTSNYYKLSAGTTSQAVTVGASQNYFWSTGTTAAAQSQFVLGASTEVIARRGLFSGYSAVSTPIFLELNIAAAPTNAHTVFVIAQLDVVYIHNVSAGSLDVRM